MKITINNKIFLDFFKTKLIIISLLISPIALANINPRPLITDHRIKVVTFEEDNIVSIEASTFTTTQVVFGKNEFIENIQNGDLPAWTASVSKQLPNMVFIKPTVANSNTNMTIITNKHTYYFNLKSIGNIKPLQTSQTYAVRFVYPHDEEIALMKEVGLRKHQRESLFNKAKSPLDYNWDYSFNGSNRITPVHVFDDGKFTYMQLQPNHPIPAVFAVDNPQGKESVVNYRREGQYLVIQQIAPQYTLRSGKYNVASIFNNQLIAKLSKRHKA